MTTEGSTFWSSGSVPLIEPEFLSSIISAASDIALVISPDYVILSVLTNSHVAPFGNLSHWEGRSIRDVLTRESLSKLDGAMTLMSTADDAHASVEINHQDGADWQFPVSYSFHRIGHEGAVLMLGRDLRPIAETQQQLVQTQIALEKGYEARRGFDARFRSMLNQVRDAVVFVAVSDGRVDDLSSAAADILGGTIETLKGSTFAHLFKDRRRGEFMDDLTSASGVEGGTDLRAEVKRTEKPVLLETTLFRAAGERLILARLVPLGDGQTDPLGAPSHLDAFFSSAADAILFTSSKGVIEAVNDSFLDLADIVSDRHLAGRNLSEFLGHGQIDLNVLIENAQRTGQMRHYATHLVNDLGIRRPVEMSATTLGDLDPPQMVFVMRDAERSENVRQPVADASSESAQRSVMELVGSTPLKDIVAETTDVVEKICIETAVNLTRNNRVAAAEMLGLSRQSLYVKLRKYGMLSKDGD
ncbi:transcriptional regulator PpsR [Pseudaestuariivita sp.]|uniref:transcriptional regulator PpsR n=1 Tax=Pseudaestuariivita sp. TaxID=2211669 RepID=UPI00405825B0